MEVEWAAGEDEEMDVLVALAASAVVLCGTGEAKDTEDGSVPAQ